MGEEENIDIETKKKFVTLWSICHKSIQLEGAERYNTEVPCFGPPGISSCKLECASHSWQSHNVHYGSARSVRGFAILQNFTTFVIN